MLIPENNDFGGELVRLFKERDTVSRLLKAALVPQKLPPSIIDSIEESIEEFRINENSLEYLGQEILATHLATMRHEATQAQGIGLLERGEAVNNQLKVFVSRHVGELVTVQQCNREAQPAIGVFNLNLKPGIRMRHIQQGERGPMIVNMILEQTAPDYLSYEATGFLSTQTAHRNDLVLGMIPSSEPDIIQNGFIIADVINSNSGDEQVSITFE